MILFPLNEYQSAKICVKRKAGFRWVGERFFLRSYHRPVFYRSYHPGLTETQFSVVTILQPFRICTVAECHNSRLGCLIPSIECPSVSHQLRSQMRLMLFRHPGENQFGLKQGNGNFSPYLGKEHLVHRFQIRYRMPVRKTRAVYVFCFLMMNNSTSSVLLKQPLESDFQWTETDRGTTNGRLTYIT